MKRFILSLALCSVLVFFSPFTIAITWLVGELVGVLFVCLFVLRLLVCISFLFLLVSGIDCDFSCYCFVTANFIGSVKPNNGSLN